MATMQTTRLSGHAARLRRNNEARQSRQQHRQQGGTGPSYSRQEIYSQEDHQAAYLQGYYNDRMAAAAVSSPQGALSPSSNSSSTPRKLLQSRRQNMMQRRIEMRQKGAERQRNQQSFSSERLSQSANQRQGEMQNNYVHQQQTQQASQSQPHSYAQHQPQHIGQSQSRGGHPNNLSLLKGHNEPQQKGRPRGQNQNVNNQHYPTSPSNEQRPPSHPNSLSNLQRQPQRSYPVTRPLPVMPSSPVLDRKQNVMGECPSTNLFRGGIQTNSPGQFRDDYGEGFEVEAHQFQNMSFQGSSRRSPSPYESPSDEVLVDDGYYEDEIQQERADVKADFVNRVHHQPFGQQDEQQLRQKSFDHVSHQPTKQQQQHVQQSNQAKQRRQQQRTQQQMHQNPHAMQHHVPMDKVKQRQPDWYQLNQNRLYQKKFATRYQNAATNSSPRFQSQSLQESQSRLSHTKQRNIPKFSPVESLSNRTDQIQRKKKQPSQNREFAVALQQQRQSDEESVTSVLDRARSFEASYARKYSNDSELRSKSVPRERTALSRGSQYYVDDDTVTESVASRKKDWESRLQPSQQKPKQVKQPPENEAFGVWSERADRLAQQRLSEQLTEQRKKRDEQRRSIGENWRRTASKSMSPERAHIKQEGQYDNAPFYSELLEHRDDHQFSGQQHSGRYADQHSIEQDSTHMSIDDRRRMLWDRQERLRAVLPKATSFDSASSRRENVSPGATSDSQGSFFKSKFVHAAAVAAKQESNNEVNENLRQIASPNSHLQKTGAVSSHYTDSTAGTTPVGSNGSSHPTQSTNILRSANQEQPRNGNSNASQRPRAKTGYVSQACGAGNAVSVMPSIAEAPRSSVADLIARINAVSRSNPEEALAAIDSIIKAESCMPASQSINHHEHLKPTQSPIYPGRPSAEKSVHLVGKDFFQSKYEEVVQETSNIEDEDESYSSSEDSTVSSMTNPTYQSIPVHNKTPSELDNRKQPQFSPPIMEELDPSKRTPRTRSPTQNNSNTSDVTDSKPSSESPEASGSRRVVETTIGGLKHRLSKSKSEDNYSTRESPTNYPGRLQQARENADQLDNSWVSVPKNYFFQTEKSKSHKPTGPHQSQAHVSKPTKEPKTQYPSERSKSKYVSDTELSHGQTTSLPSVVSDAFSGIDIDLDEEPASSAVQNHSRDVSSQVFSNVDNDVEPKKTVKQRLQELEYLAKNWSDNSPTKKQPGEVAIHSTSDKLNAHGSTSQATTNYDWATTPNDEKKRSKAEPALRLKGSKKLARKFASLVKAFESDG